jgi:hypothetical protein
MSTPTTTYTLYTAGEYVVLANNEPYENVQKVTGIVECVTNAGVGTILKKEFRYSLDCTTFSEFQEINNENFAKIESFKHAWFQFRYILLSGGPTTISKVNLTYDKILSNPYTGYEKPDITDDSKIYAFPISYKSNFLWEPYKMNKAVRLYKDLNLMVNNLFGHDTVYYRALPNGRSKDVFLMEHSLFEHDEGQCVKVVVPNNAFPDNKLNMGPFGVDFEMPFEVQVDKDYFQTIFGDGSGPQKRDVIYFPRTGRIYEISSSYLFRDFMNEPLYFKVTLIKWLPKTNVEQSETLDTLESFTVSASSLFGEEIANEEVKVTDPQQFNVATTREDPVRDYLSRDQEIIEERLINYHTIVSEFHYNLNKLANVSSLKVKIDTSNLVKDNVYYARFSPSSTQSDIQYYYAFKKLTYKGKSFDNKAIFEYAAGTSQLESLYYSSQIFGPGSLFNLYDVDYSGETSLDPVVSCDTLEYASFYTPEIIKYKASADFPKEQDRSFSAWFRIQDSTFASIPVSSFSFDKYSREIDIVLSKPSMYFVGDNIEFSRISASDFFMFGTVVSVISDTHIVVEFPQYIIDFISSSYSSWTNYTDIKVQKSLPRIFLNSLNNSKGIRIELYGKRHFKMTMNSIEHYFSLPNNSSSLEKDQWYGIFVNMSNTFRQLTLNIWKIQWNSTTNLPATTDLSLVLNKTISIEKVDMTTDHGFTLVPSSMDLTNIRLFNRVSETDKQPLILNQNIVKDAHLALIIDNALPQSKLPYIGYTR